MTAVRVSAAEALVDILDRERVEVVFGIPGGPVLPLYDRLADHPRIRHVLVKHEQAAAYAAFSYARASSRLGVCISTLGPGATNLLAGLPVALVGGAPVLAITGQVQTTAFAHGAHQESTGWFRTPDQQAMFAATCKHTATCTQPQRLADYVRHSIRIAHSSRPGPAHLILPADLLHAEVDYEALEPARYRLIDHRPCDLGAIGPIAERIARSANPVVFAGERAMYPDAGEALERLAHAFAIPVITDLSSKSVIDEHSEMFLGCMGVLGHKAGERYLKGPCDLVIAVGQTFNEISTLSWDPIYGRERDLIQIDSDEDEIGKVYPPTLATVGHVATILGEIERALAGLAYPRADRAARVRALRSELPLFEAPEAASTAVPLAPQRVVKELRDGLPDHAIVLSDSSKWARWLGRYFPARRRTFLTAHDYEPMGWAVAGALGAHLADPSRPVVCVSGDGAFLMSAIEMATAASARAPVIWVVMNDSRLGIIHDLQRGLYGGRFSATSYPTLDLVGLARACGYPGHAIERPGELAATLRGLVERRTGGLVDVRFDPDALPPVRPRSLMITQAMGLPNPVPSPYTTRAMIALLKDK